jgi:hypothetical protein
LKTFFNVGLRAARLSETHVHATFAVPEPEFTATEGTHRLWRRIIPIVTVPFIGSMPPIIMALIFDLPNNSAYAVPGGCFQN